MPYMDGLADIKTFESKVREVEHFTKGTIASRLEAIAPGGHRYIVGGHLY